MRSNSSLRCIGIVIDDPIGRNRRWEYGSMSHRDLACMPNVELAGILAEQSSALGLANEFGVKFVASSIAELYHVTQADGVVAVEEIRDRTNYLK